MANKKIRRGKSFYPGVRVLDMIRRGKEDSYFTIRYALRGTVKEEGIGYKSDGFTQRKVSLILARLKLQNAMDNVELSLKERRLLKTQKLLKAINL